MKEFDKIYLVKYESILSTRQLAEDLRDTQKEIVKSLSELKANGMYDVYKNISDYEWEQLKQLEDKQIKIKYFKESKAIQEKVKKELFNNFKANLHEIIMQFQKYEYKKDDFDRDYMQEADYEDEEWRNIGNLNYKVSNYGRIKNTNTKKLKQLKYNRFGMQVLLWQNSKSYTITISRLVAEMFIRHLEKNERAIHINGNIRDNYYKNLKIVSK